MDRKDTKKRAQRFLAALHELTDAGGGWESEIQGELLLLSPEDLSDFFQKAGRACGLLGDIAGNLLIGAEVRLAVPATAAVAGGAR